MKIVFDNVNNNSRSGPNAFSRKLQYALEELGHGVGLTGSGDVFGDVCISFIANKYPVECPRVLRLDGIYFNSEQDYNMLNDPIKDAYDNADSVIFQTEFNKLLTERYFGKRDDTFVINNGTVLDVIKTIDPMNSTVLDKFTDVWSCASSWRPHKRLKDNISYFFEHADPRACLVIAGDNPDFRIRDERVLYAGNLAWKTLISLYKRSSHFIHLAWLDHCPNVVVDARASGCKIICSDSGGTKEIAGKNATMVIENSWDLSPVALYRPPEMDFSQKIQNKIDSDIDINNIAKKYLDSFQDTIKIVSETMQMQSTLLG